jgi:eukaryotic-like serine/threonine-protein kinase
MSPDDSPRQPPPDSSWTADTTDDLPCQQLGSYRLLKKIAKGGMGDVFLAEDAVLKRRVALKFLRADLATDGEAHRRLVHEARAAAALDHPFICKIYETGERAGTPFIAMEYVEGQTLYQRLAQGPARLDEGLRIGLEIADALQYAHAHGILHRDLKPANIMLTPDGHVKVMDFGLAKHVPIPHGDTAETVSTLATAPGMVFGTLAYMSPEQVLGQPLDARSDIFAFGVVLYQVLAGTHPFRKDSSASTLDAILSDTPLPIGQLRHDVPEVVARSLERMLAKDRDARQPDMTAVRADLKWAVEMGPGGKEVHKKHPRRGWQRRVPFVAGAALVVALASVIGILMSRHKPALAFEARDQLVVADFENRTGDALFDRSLDRALAVAIQQSRYVNIVPVNLTEGVLRRMGRKDVTKLDEASAREVALREGAKSVLAPSIDRVGDAYVLTARLVDPTTHASVLSESAKAASKNKVLDALDDLATSVRRTVGESLSSIEQQRTVLPKATTSSLEALNLYARGLRLPQGFKLIEQAVAIDPDFAMAHAELGVHYYLTSESRAVGEAHFKKALVQLDRLTVRERLYITALADDSRGSAEQAATAYRAYVAEYPDDSRAWFRLGWTLMARLGRREEAIEAFKRVALISQISSTNANGNIATCYAALNKNAESLRYYELAFKQDPQAMLGEFANPEYGFLLVKVGKLDEATKVFQKMIDQPEPGKQAIGLRSLALLEMYQGRYLRAVEPMTKSVLLYQSSKQSLSEFRTRMFLESIYRMAGRSREATAQLAAAGQLASTSRLGAGWLVGIGSRHARLGNLREARRFLAMAIDAGGDPTAKSGLARTSRSDERMITIMKAEIALAAGRRAEALNLFELAAPMAPDGVARALVALARLPEARDKYEAMMVRRPIGNEAQQEWVVSHLDLGKIYERLGDTAKAREYYERLLTIWKDGDPELWPLIEAKTRLNALPGAAAAVKRTSGQ